MTADYTMEVADLTETEVFGRRLGALLFPGAVLALVGQLGAGKTHLTRAIAEGLGVHNPRVVNSPTYVLLQEYHARLPVYHFDAYRLKGAADFLDIGAAELLEGDGVCVVEWADRVESVLPSDRLTVTLTALDEDRRRLALSAPRGRHAEIIDRLRAGA